MCEKQDKIYEKLGLYLVQKFGNLIDVHLKPNSLKYVYDLIHFYP
jgi:hypothetical protein